MYPKQTRLNKIKIILSLSALALMVLVSCSKNKDPEKIAKLDPYLSISGSSTLTIDSAGGTRSVALKANGNWKVTVPGDIDWVDVDPAAGEDDGSFNVMVQENTTFESRSTRLSFSLNEELQEGVSFQIVQSGAKKQVTYDTIFVENFNWLKDTADVFVGSSVLYLPTPADQPEKKELRIDNWPDFFEKHGWNQESLGNVTIYARDGFLKMGSASVTGQLVSPELSMIEGTEDLRVTFKAIPYVTAAQNRDPGHTVEVDIEGDGTLVPPSSFEMNTWIDFENDPQTVAIWNDPGCIYSFEVKDATANTRIKIMGGTANPKNRFFVDDIVVMTVTE